MNNPLANLKDIHLPQPVSWWPLAWGWQVLIACAVFVALFAVYRAWRYWQKRRVRQEYFQQLAQLQTRFSEEKDTIAIVAALSTLLRRAALFIYPREKVAGLHQEAWLSFLDKTGQTDAFTQGSGRALITAPYQKNTQLEIDQLFDIIRAWLVFNLRVESTC